MRKTLWAAAFVSLLILGAGVAYAVGETTGTVSACASVGAQTIAVNGAPVSTVPGQSNCVTTTYTVPTVTNTVTQTVTNTVTVTAPSQPAMPYSGRLGLWHLGSDIAGLSHLSDYGLVIVSADGAATAKSLPGRTLIYSNASGIVQSYSEGLSYATASANGCLLSPVASNDKWVVDHTKANCNQLQADATVSYAKQEGLKGVFLDDVVPMNPYGITTPSGWEAGMVSFVHTLHSELKANGLYLLVNANAFNDSSLGDPNNGTGDLNWAKQLAPDGVMTEDWQETRDGAATLRLSGNAWNKDWDGWQSFAKGVQDAGMDFVGLSFNANRGYGYASAMLEDEGRSVFIAATHDGSDSWGSWVKDEGTATGAVNTNPRAFQYGTVSVNSTNGTASY